MMSPCSFARNVDVETSPDADTPRPCGVALLVRWWLLCVLGAVVQPLIKTTWSCLSLVSRQLVIFCSRRTMHAEPDRQDC